jgi:hypothetical protein
VTGRAAPSIQRQPRQSPTAQTVTRHPQEIAPHPEHGSISAGGVTITYRYTISAGADFNTLTLAIPAGVAASVTPLTDLSGGDFRVNDPGGMGARAIVISVSAHRRATPKVQVTLTRENTVYIVVFQFPTGAPAAPARPSAPGPPGKP